MMLETICTSPLTYQKCYYTYKYVHIKHMYTNVCTDLLSGKLHCGTLFISCENSTSQTWNVHCKDIKLYVIMLIITKQHLSTSPERILVSSLSTTLSISGTFLCNNEKERVGHHLTTRTVSLWYEQHPISCL